MTPCRQPGQPVFSSGKGFARSIGTWNRGPIRRFRPVFIIGPPRFFRRVGLKTFGDSDLRKTVTTLLFGLTIGAGLTGPAAAEELVMPFSCGVIGGQVSLAPSAPQTYQIYGRAEHKRLNTCSPYDPRKCHAWSVHRFDLDCGGVRTSWQSVVAALSPILAESGGAPVDAYAGPAYGPQGRAGPYRRGPGGIAFPPGFAPNPMKVAHFKRTGPVVADIPLPSKKPDVPAPSQVAAIETPAEPEAAASSASNPEAASKTPSDEPSDKAPAERKATTVADVAEHQALNIEVDSEVTGSLPKPGAASGSLWRIPSMAFTLTLALLFALSATLFLGRRTILALPMPVLRLRGPAGLPALRRSLVSEWKDALTRRRGGNDQAGLRLWDEDWLPATKREALDVLGVDPRAGRDTIKSTVTRLRRALHPDYALDDEDRLLRERRLKQINVAWDILGGKRRVPWLKVKRSA